VAAGSATISAVGVARQPTELAALRSRTAAGPDDPKDGAGRPETRCQSRQPALRQLDGCCIADSSELRDLWEAAGWWKRA